jgi:hypothetical protein
MNIIGPTQAAYIGGGKSSQDAYRWVKEGLEPAVERRMQLALKVSRIICGSESELKTQGWMIVGNPHLDGESPMRLLREGDIEAVGPELIAAARAYVSNTAQNLSDVESRLRSVIKDGMQCPDGVAYVCDRWQDRLSLRLVYVNQEIPAATQRDWDEGFDWPGWEAITAVVPEMRWARTEVDINGGYPYKFLHAEQRLDI